MSDAPRDPPIVDPPIRLAVCVSGGGTTLQNLIDLIAAGRLRAEIVQVVASKPGIGAIARAEAAGIPVRRRGRGRRQPRRVQRRGLRPDPPSTGRPGHPRRVPRAGRDPARLRRAGHQHPPRPDPRRSAARGITARPSTRPRSRPGVKVSRLHRPLRRRHLRHRPDHPPAHRARSSTTTPPRPSPPASSRPSARPCPRPSPSTPPAASRSKAGASVSTTRLDRRFSW